MTLPARPLVFNTLARAVAPRRPMRVSEWAERHRILSAKASPIPGPWRNSRNPLLVEIMDCFSARSPVRDVVAVLPIQFGKTAVEENIVGYTMTEVGGPIMVTLPGEVSLEKWETQKLNPLLDETPILQDVLTSTASRDAANRRNFKEFVGGQLYLEHAGNPARLKSSSIRTLLVDEYSSFAAALRTGDDPDAMLDGRVSAFPATYKRLKVSSPGTLGTCRAWEAWLKSDRRRWLMPCPHCGHRQAFEWSGLQWDEDLTRAWYVCADCGAVIDEHEKPAMIAAGQWVAENPAARVRGYHANCLYYPIGMGPRWLELARMWADAQGDPAKLKTFINDRLAEPWEDPAMRAVKMNVIADRAEPLPLRPVPAWVLQITAGIDTQDNRLAVQLVGWGRGMASWVVDYIELPGDPADDAVWEALTAHLNTPVEHASGALLRVEAAAVDTGGHRTEAVKHYVRQARTRRIMAIMGARHNNHPPLGRGKPVETNWRGQYDKRGVLLYQVGTVNIKHMLFGHLSADAERDADLRRVCFSDQLEPFYFEGLTSEVYDPRKNRFEKKRGSVRNEPLDTWVYAYAATLHPELRLPRWTRAQWDAREAQLLAQASTSRVDARQQHPAHLPTTPAPPRRDVPRETSGGFGSDAWSNRL